MLKYNVARLRAFKLFILLSKLELNLVGSLNVYDDSLRDWLDIMGEQ